MSQIEVTQADRKVLVTETVNQSVQATEPLTSVVITDSQPLSVVITPPTQTAAVGEAVVQSIVLTTPAGLPTEIQTPGPQGPAGEAGVPLSTTFTYTGSQLTNVTNAVKDTTFAYNPDGTLASATSVKLGVTTVTSFNYSGGRLVSTTVS
jgi:hypothetical protein